MLKDFCTKSLDVGSLLVGVFLLVDGLVVGCTGSFTLLVVGFCFAFATMSTETLLSVAIHEVSDWTFVLTEGTGF